MYKYIIHFNILIFFISIHLLIVIESDTEVFEKS